MVCDEEDQTYPIQSSTIWKNDHAPVFNHALSAETAIQVAHNPASGVSGVIHLEYRH